jgi:peptidyl-prolyl isomerase E (cyclophilin E)
VILLYIYNNSNETIRITDKLRGFGFVEFDLEEDAAAAIDNMDGAELFGKVLRCSVAKPMPKVAAGKALWSAEEWIRNSLKDGDGGGLRDIDDDEVLDAPILVPE